jgi:DNA repair protein RadD
VLIFAAGIQHARHVQRVLRELSQECGFVCGDTLPFERDETLRRFGVGNLKYLCNVNVLTTGFGAPNIGCVALLRPTNSPGLYYQMVERAFRLHPGKADALVTDFGGNILRHGPVDQLRVSGGSSSGTGAAPLKECPECQEIIAAGYATCPACGQLFPAPERRTHDGRATSEGILSDQVSRTEYEVQESFYSVHVKRDAPLHAFTPGYACLATVGPWGGRHRFLGAKGAVPSAKRRARPHSAYSANSSRMLSVVCAR